MASATTSKLVPELFREYGEITRIALNNYLPSREPRRYLVQRHRRSLLQYV